MLESLVVLGIVGCLTILGLVAPIVPLEWLVRLGWAVTVAGLAVGIPTGLWYHLRLRSTLLRMGALPPRWWLQPVPLHARLDPEERPSVILWFYVGGAGALVAFVGCVLVAAAVVLAGLRSYSV